MKVRVLQLLQVLLALAAFTVAAADQAPPANTILWENYEGIEGVKVEDLTNNPDFPKFPTDSKYIGSFEIPSDRSDNYGSRVRGFVIAPESGNYTFWIASDDASQLWLSASEDPGSKKQIAAVEGWCPPRAWDANPSQKSAPIALEKGKKYYIEALHKEGSGGDNLSVQWQLPSGAKEGPIPGNRLEACVAQPKDPTRNAVTIKVDTALPTSPGYHVMKGSATYRGKDFPIAFGLNLQKEYFFSKDNYPVIVSMHNVVDAIGGSDGNDGLIGEGLGLLMTKDIGADGRHSGEWPPVKFNPRKEAQFIGILPQCPKGRGFHFQPMSGVINELVSWAEKNFRVDSDRCYLTGFSYGGFCTWAVGVQFPERWAAIAPLSARLCPNADSAPEVLKDVGVWCAVGELDGDFKANCSKMDEIFTAAKHPNFHFTVIKGGYHHCYQSVYGNPEFWKWLLAQKRKAGTGAAPVTAAVEKK